MVSALEGKGGVRILIVDDDAEVRLLLRRCLEREAYQVLLLVERQYLFQRLEILANEEAEEEENQEFLSQKQLSLRACSKLLSPPIAAA